MHEFVKFSSLSTIDHPFPNMEEHGCDITAPPMAIIGD